MQRTAPKQLRHRRKLFRKLQKLRRDAVHGVSLKQHLPNGPRRAVSPFERSVPDYHIAVLVGSTVFRRLQANGAYSGLLQRPELVDGRNSIAVCVHPDLQVVEHAIRRIDNSIPILVQGCQSLKAGPGRRPVRQGRRIPKNLRPVVDNAVSVPIHDQNPVAIGHPVGQFLETVPVEIKMRSAGDVDFAVTVQVEQQGIPWRRYSISAAKPTAGTAPFTSTSIRGISIPAGSASVSTTAIVAGTTTIFVSASIPLAIAIPVAVVAWGTSVSAITPTSTIDATFAISISTVSTSVAPAILTAARSIHRGMNGDPFTVSTYEFSSPRVICIFSGRNIGIDRKCISRFRIYNNPWIIGSDNVVSRRWQWDSRRIPFGWRRFPQTRRTKFTFPEVLKIRLCIAPILRQAPLTQSLQKSRWPRIDILGIEIGRLADSIVLHCPPRAIDALTRSINCIF